MKAILILSIITVIILGMNMYISFITNNGGPEITGYGTSGYVNITISTVASVNFTQDTISWGAGSLDDGASNATIKTSGPTVSGGNWSTNGINPLILENIGNTNVTLTISTNKNASTLLGGSAGNRRYQWNITSNETGSCNPTTLSNATYMDVNTTGYQFCNQFGYLDSQDTTRIDFLLTIPYDGNTGMLTDTITATITAT